MDIALITRLYHEQALSVDNLPYTPELEKIVADYNVRHPTENLDHQTVYRSLVRLRKAKKLIRKTSRQRRLF